MAGRSFIVRMTCRSSLAFMRRTLPSSASGCRVRIARLKVGSKARISTIQCRIRPNDGRSSPSDRCTSAINSRFSAASARLRVCEAIVWSFRRQQLFHPLDGTGRGSCSGCRVVDAASTSPSSAVALRRPGCPGTPGRRPCSARCRRWPARRRRATRPARVGPECGSTPDDVAGGLQIGRVFQHRALQIDKSLQGESSSGNLGGLIFSGAFHRDQRVQRLGRGLVRLVLADQAALQGVDLVQAGLGADSIVGRVDQPLTQAIELVEGADGCSR